MLAIIGGSGLNEFSGLDVIDRRVVRTPYGEPSGALAMGRLGAREAFFLARHGERHTIPPHLVNYQANIWALREVGAVQIISVASVGGIRADLAPGMIVIPDQIIDYTWGRRGTFHDGMDVPVVHTDFTEPYDADLRGRLLAAAAAASEPIADGAVYAAMQGPRLESAAEINRLERDGADIVGMTGMPEAILAREAGLAYATITVVANHAAGRGDSRAAVRLSGLGEVLNAAMARVRHIIERFCA